MITLTATQIMLLQLLFPAINMVLDLIGDKTDEELEPIIEAQKIKQAELDAERQAH